MSLIGKTNEEKIWYYLYNKLGNAYGAAGLIGNIDCESAFNPKNLQNSYEKKLGYNDEEYCSAVDNGSYTNFVKDRAGWGICQWTHSSRKQNLLNYAKSTNRSIGNLEMQLDFLFKELSEDYKSVLNMLKTTRSVREASDSVMLKYERPANQSVENQERRAGYCQKYYDKYVNSNISQDTTTDVPKNDNKMKYSEHNKPLVCMLTNNTCYKNTSKMEIKGVLWHSTGANNPWLKRYVQPSDNDNNKEELLKLLGKNTYKNDWNHTARKVGMNCFVGKLADGTVTTVQTMPWDYRPWGCSSGKNGSCNSGWIQFEICEDNLKDKDYFNKIYNEACQITAYLCDMYNLDPHGIVTTTKNIKVPVILCHADSYKLGMGNNHADVLHWFKNHGKTMDDVRNDVASLMKKSNNTTTMPVTPTAPDNFVFSPYKVKVTTNLLNIRKGAGTDYKIVGTIKDNGVYTIVEEVDGKGANKWGRLKSGAGFISLDYCKKI